MDLRSYSRWYEYSQARDDMFEYTDSPHAPWHVADSNDKKRARLNIISHILASIPYEPTPPKEIKLPKRRGPRGYVEPERPMRWIKQRF
jgi:hypothetical protein